MTTMEPSNKDSAAPEWYCVSRTMKRTTNNVRTGNAIVKMVKGMPVAYYNTRADAADAAGQEPNNLVIAINDHGTGYRRATPLECAQGRFLIERQEV